MKLTIPIDVSPARGSEPYAATTELGGTPICSYGASPEQAAQRAQAAVLRSLATLVERGQAVDAIAFRTTRR